MGCAMAQPIDYYYQFILLWHKNVVHNYNMYMTNSGQKKQKTKKKLQNLKILQRIIGYI